MGVEKKELGERFLKELKNRSPILIKRGWASSQELDKIGTNDDLWLHDCFWCEALRSFSKIEDRNWKGQFTKEIIIKLRKMFEELIELFPESFAALFCLAQAYSRFDRSIFPQIDKARNYFGKIWKKFLDNSPILSLQDKGLIHHWLCALSTIGNEFLIIQELDEARKVYKECRRLNLLLDENESIPDAYRRCSERVEECSKCDYFDIRIMEKHHFKITRKQAYQILRESGRFPLEFESGNNIEVLCPNCHRKTHEARKVPAGKCLRCKNKEKSVLIKHHVIPRSAGGSDKNENLVVLCQNCHVLLHKLQYHLHTPDYFTVSEIERFINGGDNLWKIINK